MSVFRSILLSLGALAPFLTALAFHALGSAPQPVVGGGDRPALAFDQYLVDLGEVRATSLIQGRFRFRNNSDRTVEITELRPSCGCLQPRLEQRVFAPGDLGQFSVRVQPANEDPGPHRYWVDVHYEDSQPREVRVTFKVILPELRVAVQPQALAFYQLNGEPARRRILVTDYRGKDLQVIGAESSTPLASVTVDPPGRDKQGNSQTVVRVKVRGDVPPGRNPGLVTIRTDDPDFAELRVPLLIQGPGAVVEKGEMDESSGSR